MKSAIDACIVGGKAAGERSAANRAESPHTADREVGQAIRDLSEADFSDSARADPRRRGAREMRWPMSALAAKSGQTAGADPSLKPCPLYS
jgi:hypothetical protein